MKAGHCDTSMSAKPPSVFDVDRPCEVFDKEDEDDAIVLSEGGEFVDFWGANGQLMIRSCQEREGDCVWSGMQWLNYHFSFPSQDPRDRRACI